MTIMKQLVLMLGLVAPAAAFAHPAHVTWAEMSINSERCSAEISLTIAPEDLALQLAAMGLEKVRLNDQQESSKWIAKLLEEHFPVVDTDNSSTALPFRLAGYEYSHKAAWIYFEIPFNQQTRQVSVNNSILLDLQPGQVNTVVVKSGEDQQTLSFSADSGRPKTISIDCNRD